MTWKIRQLDHTNRMLFTLISQMENKSPLQRAPWVRLSVPVVLGSSLALVLEVHTLRYRIFGEQIITKWFKMSQVCLTFLYGANVKSFTELNSGGVGDFPSFLRLPSYPYSLVHSLTTIPCPCHLSHLLLLALLCPSSSYRDLCDHAKPTQMVG